MVGFKKFDGNTSVKHISFVIGWLGGIHFFVHTRSELSIYQSYARPPTSCRSKNCKIPFTLPPPPNLIPVLVFVIKVLSWIRPQSLNQTTPPFIWFNYDKILKIFYQRKQDWAMQNEGRSLGIFFVGVFLLLFLVSFLFLMCIFFLRFCSFCFLFLRFFCALFCPAFY